MFSSATAPPRLTIFNNSLDDCKKVPRDQTERQRNKKKIHINLNEKIGLLSNHWKFHVKKMEKATYLFSINIV